MNKPFCIIVSGRPGSGKTTLAKKLGIGLHLPVLSRDEVKEGYVVTSGKVHNQLPDGANWKATETFFKTTHIMIESGVSVVIEAAFQHKVWSMAIPEFMSIARVRIVTCDLDPALSAKRHLERGLNDPSREYFHGDLRVKHFRETGEFLEPDDYIPPDFDCPTYHTDTEDGYSPPIEDIVAWLDMDVAYPIAGGGDTR